MSLAEAFEGFADWCIGTSPLYERLARGVAGDDALLDLARDVPEGKSPPHMLLAAVHDRLLAGVEHQLRRFYPSVVDEPVDVADADPVPDLRDFCDSSADELRTIFRTRRTQTNAVRRSAALLPAFERVSRQVDREPLATVEVGPSAGLNLVWDRYRYDYGLGHAVGPADAPVTIATEVRGEVEPPLPASPGAAALPPVADRVGIDLQPLDVTDGADVRWLHALVWPEHDDRRRVLSGAVEAARADPPDLREGDAVDLLPGVVDDLPADAPLVVFDTQVRYQLTDEERERYREAIVSLADGGTVGAERPVHWVTGSEGVRDAEAIWLGHGVVADGSVDPERVGTYQQHGRWIRWGADWADG